MAKLEIDKQDAIRIYPKADESLKKILISTFGAECFNGDIIDRIKSFGDAFGNADEETQQDYLKAVSGYTTPDRVALEKLKLIAKVLRGKWIPNYNDNTELKWNPYLCWSSGSGFVFSFSAYYFTHADSTVGSRFCFPDKETSDFFGKQFIQLHNESLTIKK
ncbi:MAG: hypothetical protein D4R97_05480 [Bacteroidetes bacterium]|nr:MAG: hypothetical protein D4R97_05480 [Bacteroidota bacterium]